MAKKSKMAKYERQLALIEQYADIRRELKLKKDYQTLSKLPKDANPIRLKRRDRLDGRPRGYMRQFGLSRVNFRQLAHRGLLPGVKKASW